MKEEGEGHIHTRSWCEKDPRGSWRHSEGSGRLWVQNEDNFFMGGKLEGRRQLSA